ncbi:hypothetical protein BH23ACT8_BH23ACT8_15690 [soil metagenome]
MTPAERLVVGHQAAAERQAAERATELRADLAGSFREHPGMERLLAMRDADPGGYQRMSASLRLNLGYYQAAKAAAEQEAP